MEVKASTPLADARPQAVTFVSHGARVRIDVSVDDHPDVLDMVLAVLPPGAVEGPLEVVDTHYEIGSEHRDSEEIWVVSRDGERLYEGPSLGRAQKALGNALHLGVARHAPLHLFVHAGAVAWQGRVLLLPGESRSGKSSLVDALVRAGATYFSDECAPMDAEARVHPYRKPLVLRADHPRHLRSAFRERRQPAAQDEALPVGVILFAQFDPAGRWAPEPVTPGQALMRLARHTVLAGKEPERTLDVLGRLVSRSAAFATRRPDADGIAAAALRLLEDHSPEPGSKELLTPHSGSIRNERGTDVSDVA